MTQKKPEAARELALDFSGPQAPTDEAHAWLGETSHRAGCQCHRCHWAHGVIAGRISDDFETWRKR